MTPSQIKKLLESADGLPKVLTDKLKRGLVPKKRIKIASGKAKGRNLQNFVCNRLSKVLNIPWNQKDDSCPIHGREMGQAGVDIALRTQTLRDLIPFSIECKNTESLSIIPTIAQADANRYDYTHWMVVWKSKKLENPVVILPWYGWEELILNRVNSIFDNNNDMK